MHPYLVEALRELLGSPPRSCDPTRISRPNLQLDSLAVVELRYALEAATGVRMSVDGDTQVRTLGDLEAAVEAALTRSEPAIPMLKLTGDRVRATAERSPAGGDTP